MLTTGEFISADRAVELGLINRAVPVMLLEHDTATLAEQLAGKLGSAVKIGKEAFYKQLQMPVDQAYAYTRDVITANMLNHETEEGIAAFIEKRVPNWSQ